MRRVLGLVDVKESVRGKGKVVTRARHVPWPCSTSTLHRCLIQQRFNTFAVGYQCCWRDGGSYGKGESGRVACAAHVSGCPPLPMRPWGSSAR